MATCSNTRYDNITKTTQNKTRQGNISQNELVQDKALQYKTPSEDIRQCGGKTIQYMIRLDKTSRHNKTI